MAANRPEVIAVAAQKGGVGKTTLAINLAVRAGADGLLARVLDVDPQGSAMLWGDERGRREPAVDVRNCLARRLDRDLQAAAGAGVDVVMIDTAAGVDGGALAAARASDLVLVPCRPSLFDLVAVMETVELARAAGADVAVMLNGVRARGAEAGEAREVLGERGVDVLDAGLGQRVAVVHAQAAGLGVVEFDGGCAAARELGAVWAEVRGRLGAGRGKGGGGGGARP